MRWVAVAAAWGLTGCDLLPATISTEGFDGVALQAKGFWVQETLQFVQTGDSEVKHHFQLSSRATHCADLRATWDEPPERLVRLEHQIYGTTDAWAQCRARANYHAAYADIYEFWEGPGLNVEFVLWNTHDDDAENHIGKLPEQGVVYTELDGPDTDEMEWAGHWSLQHDNWHRLVAEGLDCEAAVEGGDPWADVPSQDGWTERGGGRGSLEFRTGPDRLRAAIDVVLETDGPGVEDRGSIVGDAVFERCDVERIIDPPPYVGR